MLWNIFLNINGVINIISEHYLNVLILLKVYISGFVPVKTPGTIVNAMLIIKNINVNKFWCRDSVYVSQ